MNIGFIGFGEAAYNIACGLRTEGVSNIKAYDAMQDHGVIGELVHTRATESNVVLSDNAYALTQWADIIFVAVPSSSALDVCMGIYKALHKNALYVDVSASAPSVKEQIWDCLKSSGVLFVDAAMLGSLPKERHKVPIVASGNGASFFFDTMTPYGMNITLAGEKVGAASSIKLIRSIYMKGVASLMIEMLQAADAYGVSNEVVASIAKSMDNGSFISHLDRLVTGSAIHCKRRAIELNGSIALLNDRQIASDMTVATKHRLESLETFHFSERFIDKVPTGWQDIINIMKKN